MLDLIWLLEVAHAASAQAESWVKIKIWKFQLNFSCCFFFAAVINRFGICCWNFIQICGARHRDLAALIETISTLTFFSYCCQYFLRSFDSYFYKRRNLEVSLRSERFKVAESRWARKRMKMKREILMILQWNNKQSKMVNRDLWFSSVFFSVCKTKSSVFRRRLARLWFQLEALHRVLDCTITGIIAWSITLLFFLFRPIHQTANKMYTISLACLTLPIIHCIVLWCKFSQVIRWVSSSSYSDYFIGVEYESIVPRSGEVEPSHPSQRSRARSSSLNWLLSAPIIVCLVVGRQFFPSSWSIGRLHARREPHSDLHKYLSFSKCVISFRGVFRFTSFMLCLFFSFEITQVSSAPREAEQTVGC